MKRVTLDYRPALLGRSGIGRYVRELVEALARCADAPALDLHAVFWRGHDEAIAAASFPESPSLRLRARRRPARLQAFLTNVGLGQDVGDLVHHTDYVRVPHRGRPAVFTLHDLAFLNEALWYLPEVRARIEAVTRRLVAESHLILVPSRTTAEDAMNRLGLPEERIAITPLGVNPAALGFAGTDSNDREEREEEGGPERIVALGTLEPRKNFARLIDAVALLVRRGRDLRLDLIGRRGWLYGDVSMRLGGEFVHHHADLRDADLVALLGPARVLAYPSLYEGFGLPVLEGMAAGLPVLTSNRGATAEVAGDAAELVDPESVEDIAAGLERLLDDAERRRALIARGRARAAEFTWERCAEATLAAYRRALELGPIGEIR